MKFDAGSAPETLEYDFTPWGGPKGDIPEPSDEILRRFMKSIDERIAESREEQLQDEANRLTVETAKVTVIDDPDGTLTPKQASVPAREKTTEEVFLGTAEDIRRSVGDVADLCQNSPSADDVMALPPRVRNAFTMWVTRLFMWGSPEAQPGADSTA